MPYALTRLAKADIFGIWSYIADDNEHAADHVEQAIYDACAFVAEAPMRGAVVYRPDTTPLEIVAVMRGKRNIRRVLRERQ